MEARMTVLLFWAWRLVDSQVDTQVSERHTVSILRAEDEYYMFLMKR
jgi:hypothetical protein